MEYKTTHKWAWSGSRDPISKFYDPPNNFWRKRAIRFKFGTDTLLAELISVRDGLSDISFSDGSMFAYDDFGFCVVVIFYYFISTFFFYALHKVLYVNGLRLSRHSIKRRCDVMWWCDDVITSPRWRTAAILKIALSPYLSSVSSDFDQI